MSTATIQRSANKRARKKAKCRPTIVCYDKTIQIPEWVKDLASFRKWSVSNDFPDEFVRIYYLAGEIWIDVSMEEFFSHNQLKQEYYVVLGSLAKTIDGRFCPDRMRMVNKEADLSCEPDGMFMFTDSFKKGICRLMKGTKSGFVEIEGSPDMVLEVISKSSEKKDLDQLFKLYHQASVREYWLVDVRKELRFDIFRHAEKGYRAARKTKGWVKSHVFGKSFRLTQEKDELGDPVYSLLVK